MLPSLMASSETRGSKMQFGLVTYLWGKDWDLPTLLHNCEASKVLGVELRTTHAHKVERDLNAKQRAAVKARFADSPVELVGIGSNERYDNPDPAVVKKAIDATNAFTKLSHDVGGSGVKVKPDRFHDGVPREKTIEQIGRSLNAVARYAADYGQQIRLEVHGQCAHLPTIRQIIDVADHSNLAVCWNSNDQDLEGKGLRHNFHLVKHRFGKTAHVREFNVGKYPYQQLVDLFVQLDYDGWILLEARTKPEDPIAALIKQRELFSMLVKKAQYA
ncbi:MAG: sugar phosphate isomerase/epimerase [Planctomycetes bacterium]|nr:sugar phosphate isomerase/epimerase [Planctomycetota bacterium]